ncbi:hypothetical protein HDU96_004278 [Phlyctochytrium bullatum]|nr:hypothetical protein HDU96_004278 [Phlyctochytrium bullatum]
MHILFLAVALFAAAVSAKKFEGPTVIEEIPDGPTIIEEIQLKDELVKTLPFPQELRGDKTVDISTLGELLAIKLGHGIQRREKGVRFRLFPGKGMTAARSYDSLRQGDGVCAELHFQDNSYVAISFYLLGNKALRQLLPIEFPASFQTLSQQFNINLGNVELETVASSSMTLVTSVDLKLPFRLTARLGHVSAQMSLSNARLLEFSTVLGGLNVLRNGPLMINALLGFSNGEDVQDAVAALVDSVFNRNTFGDNAVGLYGIRIGSSSENTLMAFSKVAVNVPLKDVISLPSGEVAAPPNLGGMLLDDLQLGLGAITVEINPQSTLGVELAVSFKLPFPVSLKLGSVSGGLGYGGMADGRSNQSTRLNLATDVVLAESEQAQDAVAGLVSGIFSGSSAVANIGQINFGVSRSDLIRTFSKVKAPVELTTLLKRFVPITFSATVEDLSNQLDLGITTASIETQEQASVALDAQVNLKLPLDLTVRIGYLAVSVGISGADFAAPTGINLSTRTAQTAIGGVAAFSNSDKTQERKCLPPAPLATTALAFVA